MMSNSHKMAVTIRLQSRVKPRPNKRQRSQKSQRSFSACMTMILLQPAQVMVFVTCSDDVEEDVLQSVIFFSCSPSTGTLTQLLECAFSYQNSLVDDTYACTEPFNHFH